MYVYNVKVNVKFVKDKSGHEIGGVLLINKT